MCLSKITKRYGRNNNTEFEGFQVKRITYDVNGKARYAHLFIHGSKKVNAPLRFTRYVAHKSKKRVYTEDENKTYIPGFHLFKTFEDANWLYQCKAKGFSRSKRLQLCICKVKARGKIVSGTQFENQKAIVAREIKVVEVIKKYEEPKYENKKRICKQ